MPDDIQRARVGGIEVAYETFGDPSAPPVLLVMGLGMQMLGWPLEFCELLAEDHFVVRFDNRDAGLSTHFDDAPPGDPAAAAAGDLSSVAYGLSDMAADAVGVLDALGIERAHAVGASLGGMVVQVLAIEHPDRVATLTSIMSTTGDRSVGWPTQEAFAVLTRPPAASRAEFIDRAVETAGIIGSPGFAVDEDLIRERSAMSYDRRFDPPGTARQLAAVVSTPDRTAALKGLDVPALVIHGAADSLIDISGGRATADAIPGAELLVIDGMGHDMPRGVWPPVVEGISRLIAQS